MVSMAIMVASFRDSLDAWLERILPADVYLRAATGGDTAFLPPDVQARIAALPGVRRADFLREQQLALDPARPRIVLHGANCRSPRILRAACRSSARRSQVAADAPPPVWVNEAAADLYGFTPGAVSRRCRSRDARCRSPSPASGATTHDRRARSRWSASDTSALDRRCDGHERRAMVRRGRGPRRRGRGPARSSGGDQLEISICPARFATLSLRDLRPHVRRHLRAGARRRRHRPRRAVVVVRRARARAATRVRRAAPPRDDAAPGRRDARDGRSSSSSGIGLVVGLALGFAISLILIHVVNRQSFHWGMELFAAVGHARRVRRHGARAVDLDGARERPPGDGRRRRPRGEGRLVSRDEAPRDSSHCRWRWWLRVRIADEGYPPVEPGPPLSFPRDHGSHPDFRTEWWYVTGWLKDATGRDYGVQVTFFRNRPRIAEDNPSAFAPRQLLFAHAAIADPALGRLRHDQRAARAGFGLAEAADETTHVVIDDWSLVLDGGVYHARIASREFAFDLRFTASAAGPAEGRGGLFAQGSATGAGELLLQPATARRHRNDRHRRQGNRP